MKQKELLLGFSFKIIKPTLGMSLICAKLNHVIAKYTHFSGKIAQGIIHFTAKLIQALLYSQDFS